MNTDLSTHYVSRKNINKYKKKLYKLKNIIYKKMPRRVNFLLKQYFVKFNMTKYVHGQSS